MKSRSRRKNPDDEIRRLERIAFATKDKEDIARYWVACLRADELPKPTINEDRHHEWWTLYPNKRTDGGYLNGSRIYRYAVEFLVAAALKDSSALQISNFYRTKKESLDAVKSLLPVLLAQG